VALVGPDPPGDTKREQDVVRDRAPRHQSGILEDKTDPSRRNPPTAIRREREAADASGRLGEAGDDAEQGRLPAAGRTKKAQKLASSDIEIDRLKGRNARTETLADAP
jgi:hypothetical protein